MWHVKLEKQLEKLKINALLIFVVSKIISSYVLKTCKQNNETLQHLMQKLSMTQIDTFVSLAFLYDLVLHDQIWNKT